MELTIDQLKVGKWYKCSQNWYGKFISKTKPQGLLDVCYCFEWIDNYQEYRKHDNLEYMEGPYFEADMNFITEHLPKDHPDLLINIYQEKLLTTIL